MNKVQPVEAWSDLGEPKDHEIDKTPAEPEVPKPDPNAAKLVGGEGFGGVKRRRGSGWFS